MNGGMLASVTLLFGTLLALPFVDSTLLIFGFSLAGILAGIFLTGFFSGAETAAYSSSRIYLRVLAGDGDPKATRALAQVTQLSKFVTTALIGTNINTYLCTMLLTALLITQYHYKQADLIATLILTPSLFIFGETIPKRLALVRPHPYLLTASRSLRFFYYLSWPLGIVLGSVGQLCRTIFSRLGYETEAKRGRGVLNAYIEASVNSGSLSAQQQRMVERILEIDGYTIRDCMQAESKALFVSENDSGREAARTIVAAGLGRAALADKNRQLTTQYVSLKKLLQNPAALDSPVEHFAEEALTLDQNTSIHRAFQKLKEDRSRLAIVTGKSGAPLGVVTLSDVLSQIVGAMKL